MDADAIDLSIALLRCARSRCMTRRTTTCPVQSSAASGWSCTTACGQRQERRGPWVGWRGRGVGRQVLAVWLHRSPGKQLPQMTNPTTTLFRRPLFQKKKPVNC